MITLSLSPSGELCAFREPLTPAEPGYFLDLPQDDPVGTLRVIMQTMLKRSARARQANPSAISEEQLAGVVRWLETNKPTQAPLGACTPKPVATAAALSTPASQAAMREALAKLRGGV